MHSSAIAFNGLCGSLIPGTRNLTRLAKTRVNSCVGLKCLVSKGRRLKCSIPLSTICIIESYWLSLLIIFPCTCNKHIHLCCMLTISVFLFMFLNLFLLEASYFLLNSSLSKTKIWFTQIRCLKSRNAWVKLEIQKEIRCLSMHNFMKIKTKFMFKFLPP